MLNKNCGLRHSQLVIPASFGECFTYEKQILFLKKEIENIETGGESSTLEELERKVNELTVKVNSLQTEVDNINVDELKSQIAELSNELNEKVNTTTFNENMSNIETTYEKKADADLKFATKSEISNFITSSDVDNKLTSYETKENAEQTFLKKTDAAINYVSKVSYDSDKLNYYTKSECDEKFAPKGEAPGGDGLTKEEADQLYASKSDIENLATKQELANGLNEKVSITTFDTTVAGLATKQELTTYETKTHAEQTFAKKTDIVNFVTDEQVDNKLSSYETTSHANETFATKTELNSTNSQIDSLSESKQDKLTFDNTPTEGSQNPVTSGGVYTALQNSGGGGGGVDTTLQTIPTIQYKLSVETTEGYDEPEANGKIAKYILDQRFGYGYVIFDLQNETISGDTDWKISSFHGPNDLNVWNYGRDVISAFLINNNSYVQMTERSRINLVNNEQEVIFTCKYEQTLSNAKLIVMFNFCNLTF